MRILLIGPHWDTGRWTEYCAAGLERNGHDVRAFTYSAGLARPVTLLGRVRRRLIGTDRFQLERVMRAQRRDNLAAVDLAARRRPELLIVLKGEVLLPETVDRLRALTDGPIVQWCGDDPSWFPNIVAAAHLYDWFFLAEPTYAADLAPRGVTAEFLPHAADPAAWAPADAADAEDEERLDVVFVGDSRHQMGHLPVNRERVDLIETVAAMDLQMAVWGRGWDKLGPESAARRRHRGPTLLPAAAVGRAYRAAKIVLNVHHAQMRQGVNMRTFEIPAAGAFQLSDYKSRLDELFDVGREIAVFRDRAELADRVRDHLADPDGRRAVAEAGRRRVERDHTYRVRMRQLVERATRA